MRKALQANARLGHPGGIQTYRSLSSRVHLHSLIALASRSGLAVAGMPEAVPAAADVGGGRAAEGE